MNLLAAEKKKRKKTGNKQPKHNNSMFADDIFGWKELAGSNFFFSV